MKKDLLNKVRMLTEPYRVTNGKKFRLRDYDPGDSAFWKDYMKAYEDTIRHTATKDSPWYVVPADNKWFTRLVVAAVIEALSSLNLRYPTVSAQQKAELAAVKKSLLTDD